MGVEGRDGNGRLWLIEFVSYQMEGVLTFVDNFL